MANYVVIAAIDDVPPLGQSATAEVYRGDHPDESSAVTAAAAYLGLETGQRCWACLQTAFTRYVNTTTATRSTTPG